MSRVVGLDTHSLIYRSYYAAAKHGAVDVDLVPILSRLIQTVVQKLQPDYLIAAADDASATFRHQLAPNYKAGRSSPDALKQQLPTSIEFIKNLGIPVHCHPGFEADDVLASLATKMQTGHRLVIVSSDRDLAALISLYTDLYLIRTGGHRLYTATDGHEIFGIRPERIAEYKALAGDSSDNIPGVTGIGPKGALQLLEKCSSLQELLTRCEEMPPRYVKLLQEQQEELWLSYQLALLRTDAPCHLDASVARWDQDKALRLRSLLYQPPPKQELLGWESLF
jgi:DNA polymerase-1